MKNDRPEEGVEMSEPYDVFVGVTVMPLWKKPAQSAAEVRARAELKEAFLESSGRIAEEIKRLIRRRQR